MTTARFTVQTRWGWTKFVRNGAKKKRLQVGQTRSIKHLFFHQQLSHAFLDCDLNKNSRIKLFSNHLPCSQSFSNFPILNIPDFTPCTGGIVPDCWRTVPSLHMGKAPQLPVQHQAPMAQGPALEGVEDGTDRLLQWLDLDSFILRIPEQQQIRLGWTNAAAVKYYFIYRV